MQLHVTQKSWAVLTLAAVAAASHAAVAYDNFGPGDTYSTTQGWTIAGSQSSTSQSRVAFWFSSNATGMLDAITLPVQFVGGTNRAAVILHNDDGGILGNWILASYPTGLPDFGSGAAPLTITNPFTDPNIYPDLVLNAGSNYWLEVAPDENTPSGTGAGADSYMTWNLNSVNDLGTRALSQDGGATYSYMGDQWLGAFRITVKDDTPSVPGPLAAAPFMLGAVALRCRRR